MSEHIDHFLDAYLDDELSPPKIEWVEAHLEQCPHCRALVSKRRQLSILLKEAPPLRNAEPAKEFISDIKRQLPQWQPGGWTRKQVLKLGWQWFPVGLLLGFIFIQTASFLGIVFEYIPGIDEILFETLSWVPYEQTYFYPIHIVMGVLDVLFFPEWNFITGIIAIAAIGILYIIWLVIWWAQYQPADTTGLLVKEQIK